MNYCSKYAPEAFKTTVSARSLIRMAAVSAGAVIVAPFLWGMTPAVADDTERVEQSSTQLRESVETDSLDRMRVELPSVVDDTLPARGFAEMESDEAVEERSAQDIEARGDQEERSKGGHDGYHKPHKPCKDRAAGHHHDDSGYDKPCKDKDHEEDDKHGKGKHGKDHEEDDKHGKGKHGKDGKGKHGKHGKDKPCKDKPGHDKPHKPCKPGYDKPEKPKPQPKPQPQPQPEPAPQPEGPVLAQTGASLAVPAVSGVLASLAGIGAMILGRRRRFEEERD